MRPSGARALISGTSWQTLSQLIPLVVNLALTPYVIAGFGPARYSVFLLVTSIATMLGRFDGGIGQSALRFFTVNAGRGDTAATTRLVCTISMVALAFGVVLTTVVFLCTPAILGFFRLNPGLVDEAGVLLRVLCALIGLLLLRNVFNSVLMAALRFRITATAIIVGHVVYTAGLVASVELGWGLYGVAATMIAQQVIGSLITVPPVIRLLDRGGIGWLGRPELAEFFGYAWKVQISGLLVVAQTQKDQLVAGRVLSAQESGPFGLGSNFAMQLRQLPLNAIAPIQATIGAQVGRLGPVDALPSAERLQRTWVRLITGWSVLGVPATYVGVRAWLPDSYSLSATVAAILVAAAFFHLAVIVLKVWALSLGRPDVDVRASVAGVVANVVMSFLLYWPFGLIGVVVGSALGQMCNAFVYVWAAARALPVAPRSFVRDVPWWQALVGFALASGLELWLAPMLPRGVLGLATAAFAALPAALVFAGCTFGREGLTWVRARLSRRDGAS